MARLIGALKINLTKQNIENPTPPPDEIETLVGRISYSIIDDTDGNYHKNGQISFSPSLSNTVEQELTNAENAVKTEEGIA